MGQDGPAELAHPDGIPDHSVIQIVLEGLGGVMVTLVGENLHKTSWSSLPARWLDVGGTWAGSGPRTGLSKTFSSPTFFSGTLSYN